MNRIIRGTQVASIALLAVGCMSAPRVFAGADAAPELLRLLPGKRWLAWPFSLPGVLPLARRVYAWIARRRRCLVRGYPAR